jgi:hypothetical protein
MSLTSKHIHEDEATSRNISSGHETKSKTGVAQREKIGIQDKGYKRHMCTFTDAGPKA